MTYPGTYPSANPNGPGYPAPPQSGGYGAPFAPGYPPPANRPSRTPALLTAAVAVLGIAAYLSSFGPLLSINTDIGRLLPELGVAPALAITSGSIPYCS